MTGHKQRMIRNKNKGKFNITGDLYEVIYRLKDTLHNYRIEVDNLEHQLSENPVIANLIDKGNIEYDSSVTFIEKHLIDVPITIKEGSNEIAIRFINNEGSIKLITCCLNPFKLYVAIISKSPLIGIWVSTIIGIEGMSVNLSLLDKYTVRNFDSIVHIYADAETGKIKNFKLSENINITKDGRLYACYSDFKVVRSTGNNYSIIQSNNKFIDEIKLNEFKPILRLKTFAEQVFKEKVKLIQKDKTDNLDITSLNKLIDKLQDKISKFKEKTFRFYIPREIDIKREYLKTQKTVGQIMSDDIENLLDQHKGTQLYTELDYLNKLYAVPTIKCTTTNGIDYEETSMYEEIILDQAFTNCGILGSTSVFKDARDAYYSEDIRRRIAINNYLFTSSRNSNLKITEI